MRSHYTTKTVGIRKSPHLITLFPLEVHWTDHNDPIYKRHTAESLKAFLNQFFSGCSKQVKIREIRYLEPVDRVMDKLREKIEIEALPEIKPTHFVRSMFQDFEEVVQIGEKTEADRRRDYLIQVQQLMESLLEIFLLSKSTLRIWSNQRTLERFPLNAKVRALVEIEPYLYETLDNFAINTSTYKILNTLFLHHPKEHFEIHKAIKTTTQICNWSLSCLFGEDSLTHYLDFQTLNFKVNKLNSNVKMSTCLIHSSVSEFDIISHLYNGGILKMEIQRKNIRHVCFFEGSAFNTFYFSLIEAPRVMAAILDWKKCRDIEMFDDWQEMPSFFAAKCFCAQSQSLFQEYLLSNCMVVLKVRKVSEGNEYLKRVCYEIKSKVLLQHEFQSMLISEVMSKSRNNYFQSVLQNCYISIDYKLHLKYLVMYLLNKRQLLLSECLQMFQMAEFQQHLEVFVYILEGMKEDPTKEGLTFVNNVYQIMVSQHGNHYFDNPEI